MLKPLSSVARRALILWSVSLCVGSALLAPLAAQSSGDVGSVETGTTSLLPAPYVPLNGSPRPIIVTHDPFRPDVAPPEERKASAVDHGDGNNSVVGSTVVAGTPLGGLPHTGASTVSAIITGRDAEALVIQDGRSEIVRVGGSLDGVRIVAITVDGVHLANGSVRRVYEDRP